MTYIQVRWVDAPPGEAVLWSSEVGDDGFEVRKVVTFADGHSERADADVGTDYCRLGDQRVPTLADINAQGPFEGHAIDAAEFERIWQLTPPGSVPNAGWGWGDSATRNS